MQFRIEHVFTDVSVEQFAQIYFDDRFNAALCSEIELTREVLENERTDTRLRRVTRVGPQRELPVPAQKVLGVSKIEYLEEIAYELGSNHGTWRTTPSVMADKVKAEGTFRFEAGDGRVLRVVEGLIAVNLFGIGGAVEKVIVADIEKSYEKGASFMQQWIDETS